MNGVKLSVTNTDKGLGVMISDDLKPSKQSANRVQTANKLAGFIGSTFEHKLGKVTLTMYKLLVRPLLESNFGPRIIEKTDKLERVQRRVTTIFLDCDVCHTRMDFKNLICLLSHTQNM